MRIQDVMLLENDNSGKCYLIKDGIFWRAYEKLAFWFVNNLKTYTITKKHFKGQNSDVTYLGFPHAVLNELLTLAESKGYKIDKQEKLITISGIRSSDGFEQWKEAIPYAMPDDNIIRSLVSEPVENYDSELVARIRRFPIAERTPIECQQFIIELQNTINGTI